MNHKRHTGHASGERGLFIALAVCCAVPMLTILVLTSIAGVALGPAVGVSLGLVAALVCVAVMLQHHRSRPGGADDGPPQRHE